MWGIDAIVFDYLKSTSTNRLLLGLAIGTLLILSISFYTSIWINECIVYSYEYEYRRSLLL